VALALSAISAMHRAAGFELDTRAREIRAAMKGIRRQYAAPQVQAEPLKPAMVRGILAALGDSDGALDRRDAALIALLFAGALRRSELAGIDYEAAGSGDGYLKLTHEAVEITLLRSKSRTEPITVKIPREENPGLVAALDRWIAVAGITAGEPLFRSIKKGGDAQHIRDIAPRGAEICPQGRSAEARAIKEQGSANLSDDGSHITGSTFVGPELVPSTATITNLGRDVACRDLQDQTGFRSVAAIPNTDFLAARVRLLSACDAVSPEFSSYP
jgi:hypothetical protein